ncbi:hypothetical protein [Agrobacterium tumefaciens]
MLLATKQPENGVRHPEISAEKQKAAEVRDASGNVLADGDLSCCSRT